MAAAVDFSQAEALLADPVWRLCSGELYKIMIKGDEDEYGNKPEALVIPFKPNRAQRRLIESLWHRNIILKARQLGFTTLVCIMFLDYALFNDNARCGIIAQDLEAAGAIFRDKVKFAYDNLPPELLAMMPLAKDSASELLFAHNNSSIRVATSMRSGTIHRLHVSEFGKICAKYPDKAKEVMTGSLPAVPQSGMVFIESTAEGREGEFFDMSQTAQANNQAGKKLSKLDYRFHFFPWWEEEGYSMEPSTVSITEADNLYFAEIEAKIGQDIPLKRRAWYVGTRNTLFKRQPERMWQEYPSTPEEAFQQSTEGCYYTAQIIDARKERRIGFFPHVTGIPVNTYWDIGNSDETAIWFHQRVAGEHRFIRYYEKSGEPFEHFVQHMQTLKYIWGTHYLPHDAGHVRQHGTRNQSAQEMLEELGLTNTEIVPRIESLRENVAINKVRSVFSQCTFDENKCSEGLTHLELYRKEWDERMGCWKDHPRHDTHSNGADAFRGFAQVIDNIKSGLVKKPKKKSSISWKTM